MAAGFSLPPRATAVSRARRCEGRERLRGRWVYFQITVSLRLQVCKQYLLWGLKYINMTYFGLLRAPGMLRAL